MYQPFDRGAEPVSLENLGGIRFHARGSHAFELTLRCTGVDFGMKLEISEDWQSFDLAARRAGARRGARGMRPTGTATGVSGSISRAGAKRSLASSGSRWTSFTFYGEDAWESRSR